MANSKLLKEAIADAKAVKETALANAKIALEEAFTPRLQSMLSQKMRAEAEAQDDDAEKVDEEVVTSSKIGSKADAGYPENPGAQPNYKSASDDRETSVVKKSSGDAKTAVSDFKKVADINEEEGMEDNQFGGSDDKDKEIAELRARLAELEGNEDSDENDYGMEDEGDDMNAGDNQEDDQFGMEDEGDDHAEPDMDNMGGESDHDEDNEDDMDLEAIIRELEAQLGDDESEEKPEEDESMYEDLADGSEAGTDKGADPKLVVTNETEDVTKASGKAPRGSFDKDSISEDVIDLEEILREMEADMKDDEEDKKDENVKAELNEAYKTIKSLQKTINEVNLLNAKLLFANKLFRAHNMTNEQKVKVIETLDRTNSVREVKLVYSTLAENFKFSTNKSTKKSISEGIASKVTKSTKPAVAKQVIAENTNFSDRFKKLAGIIK